ATTTWVAGTSPAMGGIPASTRDEDHRALGFGEDRGRDIAKKQHAAGSRTDPHHDGVVLAALELAQDRVLGRDLGTHRGMDRDADLIADADYIAQDRLLVGADRPGSGEPPMQRPPTRQPDIERGDRTLVGAP